MKYSDLLTRTTLTQSGM